jgi:hypothetical protein
VHAILDRVRRAAAHRLLFLPHAVRQMARAERMITPTEIRTIVEHGELIEDYPEDARGHSCLLYGRGNGNRSIHVVCSPKTDYLAIITAYLPSKDEWEQDNRTRRTS